MLEKTDQEKPAEVNQTEYECHKTDRFCSDAYICV